jgi:hypothetical protein
MTFVSLLKVCSSVADAAGRELYALDSQDNPFPKQIPEGFFRADDLINWLEQEIRDCRKADSNWLN